jgi:hypothetical protein
VLRNCVRPPGTLISPAEFCLHCLQVRFFGKFLGTHADYYVFETSLKTPPEEPEQQLGKGKSTAQHISAVQHVSATTRLSNVSTTAQLCSQHTCRA